MPRAYPASMRAPTRGTPKDCHSIDRYMNFIDSETQQTPKFPVRMLGFVPQPNLQIYKSYST
jgi:hypothetical protein